MTKIEKTIESRVVFQGPFFRIKDHSIEGAGGRKAHRLVLEHPGAACAIPLLPSGEVVMVRQFRKAIESFTLEFPAGKLESGESPEACLRRELEEEIAFRAETLQPLISYYPAFGYSNEIIHIYIATGLEPVERRGGDETYLEPETMPFPAVLEMIDRGLIRDSKTIIGAWAAVRRGL